MKNIFLGYLRYLMILMTMLTLNVGIALDKNSDQSIVRLSEHVPLKTLSEAVYLEHVNANTPVSFSNPPLNSFAAIANSQTEDDQDTTMGNNLFYEADPGYDNTSEWDSFNGANLYASLTDSSNNNSTVSITSPKNGATVSGTITITAQATDPAKISNVDFFVDSTLILVDKTEPYTATLDTTKLSNGQHKLRAIAYNNSGHPAKSIITITVSNKNIPTVNITSPKNDATVSGTITITANATDPTGITYVDFSVDSTSISSDKTEPYTATLDTTKLSNGQHKLEAIAYNKAGNSAKSIITITVSNTNIPTVSITSPEDGTTVSGTITIAANATDPVGIAYVDFSVDSTSISSDKTEPYTATLDTTKLSNGQHKLEAIAYNNSGDFAKNIVNVTVANSDLPTVTITAPQDGATLNGFVLVAADATDPLGISKIEFYVDSQFIHSVTSSPLAIYLNTSFFSNGQHTFKVIAYNTAGKTAQSVVNVTIQN